MSTYRRIPAEWIDPAVRAVIERTVRAAAIELGIAPPGIRYFREGTYPGADTLYPGTDLGRDLRGYVREIDPYTVYLASDLTPHEAVKFAAHETRHAWQGQRRGRIAAEDEETDAQQFAAKWLRKHQKGR